MLCLAISSGVKAKPNSSWVFIAGGERQTAHVLDAGADHRVVHAGGDQRRGEVDGLLGGAALAVDRGAGGLDRQALLQPGVARDVEALLTELLDAARDDVLDLGGVDTGAGDDLGVDLAEQRVGVGVLVVALLLVPAPDRGAHGLDDHDLAALWFPHGEVLRWFARR